MDTHESIGAIVAAFFLFNGIEFVRISRKRKRSMAADTGSTLLVEDSYAVRVLPIILAVVSLFQPHPGRMWWKEPRQSTQWDLIEGVVWHTSPEMRDRKFLEAYRMSYASFMYLVSELEPYLKSSSVFFVRAPLEIRKAVGMVIYRLAHGITAEIIADRFNVGASTVRKYMHLVLDVLVSQNKLFGKYISVPSGARLDRIIAGYVQSCGLPNVCGSIDGCHISLSKKPDKRQTGVVADFWCRRKSFNSVVLQACCNMDKVFWNVCCSVPSGTADGGQFKISSVYQQIQRREIFATPVLSVDGTHIQPFLLGDTAYPSRTYLLRNYKPADGNPDKIKFDRQVNGGRVSIENAFGLLKMRWRILNRVNSRVDYAPRIVIGCCVLHNFCQLMNEPNLATEEVPLRLIRGRRPVLREGRAATRAGEAMRDVLFTNWLGVPDNLPA